MSFDTQGPRIRAAELMVRNNDTSKLVQLLLDVKHWIASLIKNKSDLQVVVLFLNGRYLYLVMCIIKLQIAAPLEVLRAFIIIESILVYGTLVPEAFLYSLLANFVTRTSSFNCFYWHEALRAEKRKV